MNLKQIVAIVTLAAATSLTGIVSAEAARATVTANVNVRAGPGTDFRVVNRLRAGDRVEVRQCNRSGRWCQIDVRRGRDGWVSSRYLSHRGSGRPGSSWDGRPRPGSICFHGAHGQICIAR